MTDTGRPPGPECALPGLSPVSTTQERIAALLKIGLPASELRKAIGVSEATIRNWNEQATVPRGGALRALDDLRTSIVALHESGLEGERAVGWLTSRNLGRWLRGARPIDTLAIDPLLTLAAIQDLLPEVNDGDDNNVIHLHIEPDAPRVSPTGTPRAKTSHDRPRRRRAGTRT
jgi:hypothetical protein